jgi:excinuclease UvrABC ATPase subunit
MTVDAAFEFFADDPSLCRSLSVLREVGLGYSGSVRLPPSYQAARRNA